MKLQLTFAEREVGRRRNQSWFCGFGDAESHGKLFECCTESPRTFPILEEANRPLQDRGKS